MPSSTRSVGRVTHATQPGALFQSADIAGKRTCSRGAVSQKGYAPSRRFHVFTTPKRVHLPLAPRAHASAVPPPQPSWQASWCSFTGDPWPQTVVRLLLGVSSITLLCTEVWSTHATSYRRAPCTTRPACVYARPEALAQEGRTEEAGRQLASRRRPSSRSESLPQPPSAQGRPATNCKCANAIPCHSHTQWQQPALLGSCSPAGIVLATGASTGGPAVAGPVAGQSPSVVGLVSKT